MTRVFQKLPLTVQERLLSIAAFLRLNEAWFWKDPLGEARGRAARLRGLWRDTLIGIRRKSDTQLKQSTLMCFWTGCGVCIFLAVSALALLASVGVREASYGMGLVAPEEAYPVPMTRYQTVPLSDLPVRRIERTRAPNLNQVKLPDGRVADFPDAMSHAEIVSMMALSYGRDEWEFIDPDAPYFEVTLPGGSIMQFPEYTPKDELKTIVEQVGRLHYLAQERSKLILLELWAVVGYLIAAFAAFGLGRFTLYFAGGM